MILAVVDRIESGLAVLEFEDGSLLTVPAEELPLGLVEGEFVTVRLEAARRHRPEDRPVGPDQGTPRNRSSRA